MDGKLNGYGRFVSPDGDVYQGNFLDNKASGEGVFFSSSGAVYEG